jgi:hypothetical protein
MLANLMSKELMLNEEVMQTNHYQVLCCKEEISVLLNFLLCIHAESDILSNTARWDCD